MFTEVRALIGQVPFRWPEVPWLVLPAPSPWQGPHTWVASVVLYVLTYEWLHLAYHLPADGAVGRLRATRWLRRHHQRHHHPPLMQRWNFNVTLPLWDHVRGTVWHARTATSTCT